MKSFYNTTKQRGATLATSEKRAETQEEKIMAFFQENATGRYAPHEVIKKVFSSATPLTSVRRAMTNLSSAGKLVKTGTMARGPFGVKTNTWRLKRSK